MKYRVHRFDCGMTIQQSKLEQALNQLEGEVVAIVPNVTGFPMARVSYLLIVEKELARSRDGHEAPAGSDTGAA